MRKTEKKSHQTVEIFKKVCYNRNKLGGKPYRFKYAKAVFGRRFFWNGYV